MVVVVDEKVFYAVAFPETAIFIERYRKRSLARADQQPTAAAAASGANEFDHLPAVAHPLILRLHGEVFYLADSPALLRHHAGGTQSAVVKGEELTAPQIPIYHVLLFVGKQQQFEVLSLILFFNKFDFHVAAPFLEKSRQHRLGLCLRQKAHRAKPRRRQQDITAGCGF